MNDTAADIHEYTNRTADRVRAPPQFAPRELEFRVPWRTTVSRPSAGTGHTCCRGMDS